MLWLIVFSLYTFFSYWNVGKETWFLVLRSVCQQDFMCTTPSMVRSIQNTATHSVFILGSLTVLLCLLPISFLITFILGGAVYTCTMHVYAHGSTGALGDNLHKWILCFHHMGSRMELRSSDCEASVFPLSHLAAFYLSSLSNVYVNSSQYGMFYFFLN